jgi:hypothetical protein
LNRFPRSTHAPAFPPRTLTSSTKSSSPTIRMLRGEGRGREREGGTRKGTGGQEGTGKAEKQYSVSVSLTNK